MKVVSALNSGESGAIEGKVRKVFSEAYIVKQGDAKLLHLVVQAFCKCRIDKLKVLESFMKERILV